MDWNTKAFLKFNSLAGKNKWADAIGRAGAEWVIIAMMGWYMSAVIIDRVPLGKQAVFWPLAFLVLAWGLAWVISLFIGLLSRKPRPYVTLPQTTKLFVPLVGAWKSFPSDHATFSFLIFFMALIFNLSFAWPLLFLAIWVCVARVYSGVHYPFDIVGGIALAGLVAMIFYDLLLYLTF